MEVHLEPSGPTAKPGYAVVRRYARGDQIPFPGNAAECGKVPVDQLLPPLGES